LHDVEIEIAHLVHAHASVRVVIAHRREQLAAAEETERAVRTAHDALEARRKWILHEMDDHEDRMLNDRVHRVAGMVLEDVRADLRSAQALLARVAPVVPPVDGAHTSAPPAGDVVVVEGVGAVAV
jgi:hypothetical protein